MALKIQHHFFALYKAFVEKTFQGKDSKKS